MTINSFCIESDLLNNGSFDYSHKKHEYNNLSILTNVSIYNLVKKCDSVW